MIAVYASGNFLLMPAYAGRVTHLPTGGLRLANASVADSGNYSLHIRGHNASGAYLEWRRTLSVKVVDSLMTTDNEIHAAEEPTPRFDNSDQQYHIVLSCGNFTYMTYPPFEVEWTLPGGKVQNSTTYARGQFELHLANPVQGGNYTCRISQHSLAQACLLEHSPSPAHVKVDSFETRLKLLEIQQTDLQADNQVLKSQHSLFQDQMTSLVQQLRQLHEVKQNPVSFQARVETRTVARRQEAINFTNVLSNHGNSYNATSGKFTAPVNGTYVFSAAVWSGDAGFANAQITVDGRVEVCPLVMRSSEHVSCLVVLPLLAGQQVWVHAYGDYYSYKGPDTAFTGFLLG